MSTSNIEIHNDEQAKQIISEVKRYYENSNPNIRFYYNIIQYDQHKKYVNEHLKQKYATDPEYRARKYEQNKINSEKRKEERKKIREEKKIIQK